MSRHLSVTTREPNTGTSPYVSHPSLLRQTDATFWDRVTLDIAAERPSRLCSGPHPMSMGTYRLMIQRAYRRWSDQLNGRLGPCLRRVKRPLDLGFVDDIGRFYPLPIEDGATAGRRRVHRVHRVRGQPRNTARRLNRRGEARGRPAVVNGALSIATQSGCGNDSDVISEPDTW